MDGPRDDATSPPLDTLVGAVGAATVEVTDACTALALGSGDLPVLATPRMIALMEQAACDALAAALPPGSTSVGTRIDVGHTAPTPLGAAVRATARVTDVAGAKVTFEVTASHELRGQRTEIGRGTHVRVVVDRARFVGGLG